jgi:GNAT superfamily N-acetyltransferase
MIRKFEATDQMAITKLIESEGYDWKDYFEGNNREKYWRSLTDSITYVKVHGDEIIGYLRAIDDHGYDLYVCDLLVHQDHRGQGYGKEILTHVMNLYPNRDIYVMSDVDPYYEQLGYDKIGSIFQVKSK